MDIPSLWDPEPITQRARSFVSSRTVATVFQLLVALMLVVAITLLGVMVGRRDPDLSHAVKHLFVRVDSERLPLLPHHYARQVPDVMIVVGDAWAAGLGVSNTADDAWWAQLHARQLPEMAVIRSTNATARAMDMHLLVTQLALPSTLQSRHVAVVVQCGWNDIVAAQTIDNLDIHEMADALVGSVRTLVARSLSRAASVAVYIIDYADPSAGTGFTGIECEPPLNRIYNHAAIVDTHLRALDMYTQALLAAARNSGYAFVPLRSTLRAVGSAEAMHTVSRLNHDVPGWVIPRNDAFLLLQFTTILDLLPRCR